MGGAALDVTIDTPDLACAFVDELGPSAIGELVAFDDQGPRGAVFVERGRVCWAAARGLSRRLTQLLVDRAALTRTAMESVFVACRSQRIPLGEHLVDRGILEARDLRDALLRHTVESLRHLCRSGSRALWAPRGGPGYRPHFTFATSELLAEIGAAMHDDIARGVRPTLAASFGDEGGWGAAFVRSACSAHPQLVAMHGHGPHAATTLLRLGRWAASSLDLTNAFTDESALLAVSRGPASNPKTLIAFRHGGSIIAGETGVLGSARILNQRAQDRRKRGNSDGGV